jgi:hypothetical protein
MTRLMAAVALWATTMALAGTATAAFNLSTGPITGLQSNSIVGFAFDINFAGSAGPENFVLTIDANTNAGAEGMFSDVDRTSIATSAATWNAGQLIVGSLGFGAGAQTWNYTTPNYAGTGNHRFAVYLEPSNAAGTFPLTITVSLNNGAGGATAAVTPLVVAPQVNILQGANIGVSGTSTGMVTVATNTAFPWIASTVRGGLDELQFQFTVDFGGAATTTTRNIGLYGNAFTHTTVPPQGTGDLIFDLYDVTADGFSAPPSATVTAPSVGGGPFGGGEAAATWAVPAGRQGVHTFRVIVRGGAAMLPNILFFFGVSFDSRLTLQALTFVPATATPRIAISPAGSALTASPTTLTASGGTAPSYNWSIQGATPTGVSITSTTGATTDLVFGATTPTASTVTIRCTNGTGPEFAEETYTLNFGGGGNTVSVTATDSSAGEPSDNGAWTITFSAQTTASTDVNFSLSGSALLTADYTLSVPAGSSITATAVTVPAGITSVVVTLTVVDDGAGEGTENAVMTLTGATGGYTVGAPSQATVNITDDDAGPSLTITTTTLPNGQVSVVYASGNIVAQANGGATGPFTWSVSSGALPGGLSLGGSTGLTETITGTPTAAGTFNFDLQITNGTVSDTQS